MGPSLADSSAGLDEGEGDAGDAAAHGQGIDGGRCDAGSYLRTWRQVL